MPYHLLSVEDTEVWPGETDTLTGHCPVGKEEHNAIWSWVCSKVELAGEYIRDPIVFFKVYFINIIIIKAMTYKTTLSVLQR